MITKENVKVNEFGEIITAEQTIVKKVNAEEFCQVYLKDSEDFSNLTGSEYRVLIQCWLFSNYYKDEKTDMIGNMITYNGFFKEQVIQRTGLKEGTIKNAISSLVKKGMLIKDKSKGVYYLNPKYFFKGKLGDRTKLIKRTIEYQFS